MRDVDPRDVAIFSLIEKFFREHPPHEDKWFSSANLVDEKYAAAVRAAFPDDGIVAVAEEIVIQHKVTILGCEIVGYGRYCENLHRWSAYRTAHRSWWRALTALPNFARC